MNQIVRIVAGLH